MKPSYDDEKDNFIEKKARELYGFDDASLLREIAEAERELVNNPEEAGELKQDADLSFDLLMSRLDDEGKRPITVKEYERNKRKEERRKSAPAGRKKKLVLVAAAAVLAIGASMGTVARQGYKYQFVQVPGKRNIVVRYNGVQTSIKSPLEEAYDRIDKELDIPVIALDYIPSNMLYSKISFLDRHAVIEFIYNDNYIYLAEGEYPLDMGVSAAMISDRKTICSVHNAWINKDIDIEENKLEEGLIEYSASIDEDQVSYRFCGIMDLKEFKDIVESFYYLYQ